MKARSIAALTAIVLLGSPVRGQLLRPGFVGPAGERRAGQYVWIWRSETIPVNQSGMVEADCPANYVVMGGGYHPTSKSGVWAILESVPNAAVDGWVVGVAAGDESSVRVTVYAGCTPIAQPPA